MAEYRSNDWKDFAVDWRGAPYPVLESEARERDAVKNALDALIQYEAVSGNEYNEKLFLAYRKTMLEKFRIPWTGIGRRMQRLVGIEIEADPAGQAAENLEQFDPGGVSEIVEGDAISWLQEQRPAIDLLYIDADGAYLEVIEAAAEVCLKSGSLVLAHNSENLVHEIGDYLTFVRDPAHSKVSVNVVIDDAGLEVTRWR